MARIRIVLIVVAVVSMALPAAVHAAFPGQNGKIAFVSNRDTLGTGNLEIYTMNPDGSDVARLTTDPAPDDNPAWSPDGSKIAFDGSRGGQVGVFVMNADGSEQRAITGPGFSASTGDPSWSPDGSKIVFEGVLQGANDFRNSELYVVNSEGTGGVTRLTNNTVHDVTPSWSPDGSKIAFARFVSPCATVVCNYEIFVMNAGGTGEERLTSDSDQDTDPNWSPDGASISWGSLNGTTDIEVMNADGSGQHGFSPPALGYEPSWSPRGDMIAWANQDIYVMNADGTGRRAIAGSSAFDDAPDWQPIPNEAPDCSTVTPSRTVLKAHGHRLVQMSLSGATDPDGDPVTLGIDAVTQDEPVRGDGDRTAPDAVQKGDGVLRIRAERNPRGDGRVYRIAFTASDDAGGSCSGEVTVSVPRKEHKPAVDSAPPSYDSLAR